MRDLASRHWKAEREASAEQFGFLEERLAGTEDIRSSGAVDFIINELYKLQHIIQGHWRKAWMRFIVVHTVGGMMLAVGTALVPVEGSGSGSVFSWTRSAICRSPSSGTLETARRARRQIPPMCTSHPGPLRSPCT